MWKTNMIEIILLDYIMKVNPHDGISEENIFPFEQEYLIYSLYYVNIVYEIIMLVSQARYVLI